GVRADAQGDGAAHAPGRGPQDCPQGAAHDDGRPGARLPDAQDAGDLPQRRLPGRAQVTARTGTAGRASFLIPDRREPETGWPSRRDLEDDHGDVVPLRLVLGEGPYRVVQVLDDAGGRVGAEVADDVQGAVDAERRPVRRLRLDDAVGQEQHQVARLQGEDRL